MEAKQFAQVYRSELSERRRQYGVLPELMYEAREWSYHFGQILHRHLAAPSVPQVEATEVLPDYNNWLLRKFPPLEASLVSRQSEESNKAFSELGFHRLNVAMQSLWYPVLNGGWNNDRAGRDLHIRNTQDLLALNGLRYYLAREEAATMQANYAYFAEQHKEFSRRVEGALNELDAAIILTEVIRKRPDLTVVPGPVQFEHGLRSRHNVDFLITSEQGTAVGIQVKSKVFEEHREHYDTERIVLLDAGADFGNVRARRIKPGSSRTRQVSWAGMICASRVGAIPSHGEQLSVLKSQGLDPRFITRQKMIAQQVLHGIRPRWDEAIRLVSPRILERV